MKVLNNILIYCLVPLFALSLGCQNKRSAKRILVFSKTEGYRHKSIEAGQMALMKLGAENNILVDTTENAALFTEESLAKYSAVVFLSTTQNVLDYRQQADFERYIQSGGGFVGIHAAADTEYHWPWYGKLVGAYFKSHPSDPNVLEGKMKVVNKTHISTSHLQDEWVRTDEFYNFKSINPNLNTLIEIDESSYEGGENGDFHPMSWYHDFDGGRAWYTNFGHTNETFEEKEFLAHLLGGIHYAIGENLALDYSKAKTERVPDDKRFVMEVLGDNLNEPAELHVLDDGKVLFTERRGKLNLYDPASGKIKVVGKIDVHTKFEDGLMGLSLDPNFEQNSYLYLYYSPKGEEAIQHLSRFEFTEGKLDMGSEKIMLVVPVQRDECCHTGGSIQFGPDGLLYLSTGDDTNPFETGYAPINELPGRSPWDAQKSSANPNDLRGKILRIRPTAEGSYEIPEGNLFPADGSEGRPEVYVMGCRNPYRISIDPKTKFLYWGEVGPDARVNGERGPRGYDEVNQAREAGFFGWPLFVGNNYAYREVDFADKSMGDFYDAAMPVNNSPNNTGKQALPPAQPAFIWYPYVSSPEFPIVGEGGRNAMAGPVFYHDLFEGTESQFPAYYDGKLFIYDFMRDWIFAVTMEENGDLEKIEPFLPELELSSPVDMEFGPDGALYILEYGTRWFAKNKDARLIRIDYKAGNRAPKAEIMADKQIGAAPLTVKFSAEQSFDYDEGDALSYNWTFPAGAKAKGIEASHTFEEPGIYEVSLQVSDEEGARGERSIEIQVGNDPPQIKAQLQGSKTFFWREKPVPYAIDVVDREDGSLSEGSLAEGAVAISFNYLNNSKDRTIEAQDHAALANASLIAAGKELIGEYGCIACHAVEKTIVGPSYQDVSEKYQDREDKVEYIIGKIINGGNGVWGANAMPAQAQVSEADAEKMAIYLLSIANNEPLPPSLDPKGTLTFNEHQGLGQGSSYTLQISYQDNGGDGIGPLEAYESYTLRSPEVSLTELDLAASKHFDIWTKRPENIRYASLRSNGVAMVPNFDLSQISALSLRYYNAFASAKLEIRIDAADGPVLATLSPGKVNDNLKTQKFNIASTEGIHDLYLVVSDAGGAEGNAEVFGLQWLYVHPPE
ncbi:MAG: ThuA domain-containing protein [Bacteroidota bacterium]